MAGTFASDNKSTEGSSKEGDESFLFVLVLENTPDRHPTHPYRVSRDSRGTTLEEKEESPVVDPCQKRHVLSRFRFHATHHEQGYGFVP